MKKERLIALALVLALAGTAAAKSGNVDWAMKLAGRRRKRRRAGKALRYALRLGGRR